MKHPSRSTRLRTLQMLLILPMLLAGLLAACSSAQEPADRYDYGRADRAKLPPMTLLNHQSIMGDLLGKPAIPVKTIGILVYEDFFTMDAIGPLTMLSQLPNARVRLIRFGGDDVLKSGRTQIRVPTAAADVNALDALLIPGGSTGTWQMAQDPQALAWIRKIDTHSRYTGSVCSGAWILGATGLLQGRKATTNWYRARQMMDLYGSEFTPARYMSDGKYWTSAGVSADM